LDPNVRFAGLVEDLEWEVFDVRLDLGVGEFTANEALGIENTTEERSVCRSKNVTADGGSRVVGIHGDLILGSITNKTFGIRKGDIRGGRPITLVVGDDLNAIVLPDTDTTVWM
jgi:hypothetical protein